MNVPTPQLWKIFDRLKERVNVMGAGCGHCEYDEADGALFRHCNACLRRECWMWTGARNSGGYPVMRVWGRGLRLVRRLVAGWAQKRHIPPGIKVQHTSPADHATEACCNPCHLDTTTESKLAKARWAKARED